MSEPLSHFEWWETGTTQPSIPVNNNALRTMIGMKSAVSDSVTAQPSLSSPDDDGTWYVIPSGATGSQWDDFAADSCAIFYGGNWYEFTPEDGDVVSISCVLYCYTSSAGWTAMTSGGGASVAPVVTYSGTALTATASNDGNYTRFTNAAAKTYTFNDSEGYSVDAEYHGRNVGAGDLTITEAGGMTINAPAGGTLVIPQGGTFTVKIVASDEADLFGVTEAV